MFQTAERLPHPCERFGSSLRRTNRLAPQLELCLPRPLRLAPSAWRWASGLQPEFWPQGQTDKPTPFSAHSATDFADRRKGASRGVIPGSEAPPLAGRRADQRYPSATAASAGSRRSPTSQPQRGEECRKPRRVRSVNEPSVVNPEAAGRAKAGPAWYLSPRELSALLSVARGPARHQSALSRVSGHPCCARLTQQLQLAHQALYPPTPPFSSGA